MSSTAGTSSRMTNWPGRNKCFGDRTDRPTASPVAPLGPHRRQPDSAPPSVFVMAGPGPAIHVFFTLQADHPCTGGWICIMTNRRNGTLYVGVTSDLTRRVWSIEQAPAAASFIAMT